MLHGIRSARPSSIIFRSTTVAFMSNDNESGSLLARRITSDLEKSGIPAKKAWWERYLKHKIMFYGVPMGEIRTIINRYENVSKETAWELFKGGVAEQKLAAILVLQKLKLTVEDLSVLQELFRSTHIDDWNTTDWLCVKALGDLVSTDDQAVQIMKREWSKSGSLWQKRASLVAFVNHSAHPAVLPIAKTILMNSSQDDRFIMTAIGWVLRNRSESEPQVFIEFLKTHESALNEEAKNMMTAKLNEKERLAAGRPSKRRRR